MGTENLARGNAMFAALPFLDAGAGIRMPQGVFLPAGGRVAAYVRSTGIQDLDPTDVAKRLVPTLDAGLKRCRSGMGDVVYVLPGHTENITAAGFLASLVAGTRIIGWGTGGNMPVFRWTAAASQMAVSVADVVISGLRLRMEGANGVTKALVVTAADFSLNNCDIEVASGAALKATIAIELGVGAARAIIAGNRFRGTATHNVTDGIKVVSTDSDIYIGYNNMIFSATAGNGLVHVTGATLSLLIEANNMYNTHTASTACIAVDDVACDGVLKNNTLGVLSNGTASAQGIVFAGATSLIKCFQNFCSDEKQKSGLLAPAAAT